jgi:glycosyltransferase involved in cell wall biosynthesis
VKKIILVSRCAWTLYNFRAGLLRALKNEGHLVIAGGAGGDGFEKYIRDLGLPFVALPIDKNVINPWADLKLLWTLYRFYRTEQPAVVHHFTIKPVIYGSIAARLAGVPRIVNTVTGLGQVFVQDNTLWLWYLVKWLYSIALACAHFTFFQNRDDLDYFIGYGMVQPQKAGLLPGSGVDCSFFTPVPASVRSHDDPVTFLMVSRLLRVKGVEEFVEAARQVKERFPTTQFQLLGPRDERNPTVISISELNRWQSEGVVRWLGETSDVRPVLAQADVITLPSYYREGTPRALLEAAAMAKPIITTENVGCREVVEDGVNGLLVPVKDAKALAEAMIRLLEDPALRERMGKAGRAKVEQQFEERSVIKRVMESYNKEALHEGV